MSHSYSSVYGFDLDCQESVDLNTLYFMYNDNKLNYKVIGNIVINTDTDETIASIKKKGNYYAVVSHLTNHTVTEGSYDWCLDILENYTWSY